MYNRLLELFKSPRGVFRNFLSFIIFITTMFGIFMIARYYYCQPTPGQNAAERIFESLLPLFATWIGTVLAFYFGRSNFETVANQYQNMIKKLNPDLLDDINLIQVMIPKKTMLLKEWSQIKDKPISEIIVFLTEADKSRLPILENGEPKYVIHKSTFLEASALNNKRVTEADANTEEYTVAKMVEDENFKIKVSSFKTINENDILEKARGLITGEQSVKDIFVIGNNKQVVGWLTDSLILRFLAQ